MKLTAGVNFAKFLQAAKAPIFLCQKITITNCNHRKASAKLFRAKKTPFYEQLF